MSDIIAILKNVHFSVHYFEDVKPTKKYSTALYTGGVNVSQWSKFNKSVQQEALKKNWYLRWSYRNPETGKLERQDNIKAGVNWYKTKEERLEILKSLQRNLERLLKKGYSPYNEDSNIGVDLKEIPSVEQAIDYGLQIKAKTLGEISYKNLRSRIKRFEHYLAKNGYSNRFITSVDKKIVNRYLNDVLQTSSPRNRNNTRADISSLFQVLEDNDMIPVNFVKKIPVLKSQPKRNKTYTGEQVKAIHSYLEVEDPQLLLFIKFVSYNFLRPVEVCRLQVGDINFKEKTLTVKAKNKALKRKIIPEVLIGELPDFSEYDADDFLFTPEGCPGKWETAENNKRDFFSKRFNRIKKHFDLGKEYGLYSFRHTFITKLYREIRKDLTPFETKSKLMLITGHTTMTALEKYLRDIDAELPEDYSDLLK